METVERVEEKEEEVKDTRTHAEKAYSAVQGKRVSSHYHCLLPVASL